MSDTRPQIVIDADAEETGLRFLGIPERWLDAPQRLFRCHNGHVSRRYLKSEARGDMCLAENCQSHVYLTFPEDHE